MIHLLGYDYDGKSFCGKELVMTTFKIAEVNCPDCVAKAQAELKESK